MDVNFKPYSLNINKNLYTIHEPKVMGILNVTSDSFYDGGRFNNEDNALRQVEKMLNDGADFIDIGGQSTKPGADDVLEAIELNSTSDIIGAIIKRFPAALISIDTSRYSVAKSAVESGAVIVNDISAGERDAQMLPYLAKVQLPFIAMHKQGTPKTMQINPQYDNVCKDILKYFNAKKNVLNELGIKDIILDVGFGFGKTIEHNYDLLTHLNIFHSLNCPLLVGVSRKGMIWKVLGTNAENALPGTTAANTIALLQGAHILRVHDVKEAKDAIKIVGMLK
ncbi:MAG: dihydropteroate synthase [bacterium]|nr:dihydropteroate synthase [bacterium]